MKEITVKIVGKPGDKVAIKLKSGAVKHGVIQGVQIKLYENGSVGSGYIVRYRTDNNGVRNVVFPPNALTLLENG